MDDIDLFPIVLSSLQKNKIGLPEEISDDDLFIGYSDNGYFIYNNSDKGPGFMVNPPIFDEEFLNTPYVNVNPENGKVNILDYTDYDANNEIIKRAISPNIPYNFSDASDNKIANYGWTKEDDKYAQYADSINYVNRNNLYATPLDNGGKSACTLFATNSIDPTNPIASSGLLHWFLADNPDYGYKHLPENEKVLPGNLAIYTDQGDPRRAHSAVVIGSAKKRFRTVYYGKEYIIEPGDRIIAYTTGTTHSSGHRIMPEKVYLDNSKGKTMVDYYTYDKKIREILNDLFKISLIFLS